MTMDNHELFSTAFFKSPLMMILTEAATGKIIDANEQFTWFYGYEKAELIGKTSLELNLVPNPGQREAIVKSITETGFVKDAILQVRGKGGETRWMSASVHAVSIGDKKYFLSVMLDVDERTKAEEQIKEYKYFFNNTHDLTCIANVQGYFEALNPNWEKMLGYSKKELLEKQFLEFIHPDDIEATLQEIDKLKTGAVTINFVNRYRKKDGTYLWFDWNSTPDPVTGKLYAIARDVTEQKKADEQIKQLNAELEQKIIERTAKLAKAEMQIRNFARHLNQVLEDERAHIAREIHDDIGQQLAGIKIGFSSLKKTDGATPLKEERVNTMMRDVDVTIQSLRQIATALRPGILDSLGLIPSIEWLASEFEKKTGITCHLEVNGAEKEFEKNISTCFFRICQESLTNISKHAQAGEVKIKALQNDKEFLLEISDNGKGIATDKLENPFSMGLLGMRERANIIGANLQIISKQNAGTTVQLKTVLN